MSIPSFTTKMVPLALRERRLFESDDLDFVRERISAVLQPHTLRPAGGATGRLCHLEHLAIDRVGIGTIMFGEMQVHVPQFEDYYLLLTCISGAGSLQINREDCLINQRRGVIIAPGEQMFASFSRDCEQLFVSVRRQNIWRRSRRRLAECGPRLGG